MESREKTLSIRSRTHMGRVVTGNQPWQWDPESQTITFSCRCCSQQPACCSSWTFGRTAVTFCSLSCTPPTAWASALSQTCTLAPTSCSRPTPMQVRQGGPRFLRAGGFDHQACQGPAKVLRSGSYGRASMIWLGRQSTDN